MPGIIDMFTETIEKVKGTVQDTIGGARQKAVRGFGFRNEGFFSKARSPAERPAESVIEQMRKKVGNERVGVIRQSSPSMQSQPLKKAIRSRGI